MLNKSCTASRPFLILLLPWQWAGWECAGICQGTQLVQMTPSDQRDIPDHMMSFSAIKNGRRRGHLALWCFSSQVTIVNDEAQLSWKCLNTCLPMGNSKSIPYFSLYLFQPWSFSLSPFWFSTPSCYKQERVNGCVGWGATGVKPGNTIDIPFTWTNTSGLQFFNWVHVIDILKAYREFSLSFCMEIKFLFLSACHLSGCAFLQKKWKAQDRGISATLGSTHFHIHFCL